MRNMLLLAIGIITAASASGQTFHQKLLADRKQGRLTEAEAVYLEALRTFVPEELPETYRDLSDLPVKCGFPVLARLKTYWSQYSEAQKAVINSSIARAEMPFSYISPSGLFKIHYTTVGIDAVSDEDADFSGIPDYVESTAEIMDHVYEFEVEYLGLNPPPGDLDIHGPEWDVYLLSLSYYGLAIWEYQRSEDPDVWTSYMKLENDYSGFKTSGLDGMRVTAAHEFFHMIQFGYNFRDDNNDGKYDDIFLMEAGAVWMEDAVYDDINDYYNYLSDFFRFTNVPFDYTDGWREYGLSLWFHFLEKRLGGFDIVRMTWEQIVGYPAIEATDRALREVGTTFEEELSVFYGWNYMTGTRSDTIDFYPEGDHYPEIFLDGTFAFVYDTTVTRSIRRLASRYFRFTNEDDSRFTLIPTNLDRYVNAANGDFELVITRSMGRPAYTDLGMGIHVNLVSENYRDWRCVGVMESASGNVFFLSFSATPKGDISVDLPSSYPNPFRLDQHSLTTIPFFIDQSAVVQIVITTASGYAVRSEERYYEGGGLQLYHWNGRDEQGDKVPSGIYTYAVAADNVLVRRNKFAVVR